MFKFLGPVKDLQAFQVNSNSGDGVCYGIVLTEEEAISLAKKVNGSYEPVGITSDNLLIHDNTIGTATDSSMSATADIIVQTPYTPINLISI